MSMAPTGNDLLEIEKHHPPAVGAAIGLRYRSFKKGYWLAIIVAVWSYRFTLNLFYVRGKQ